MTLQSNAAPPCKGPLKIPERLRSHRHRVFGKNRRGRFQSRADNPCPPQPAKSFWRSATIASSAPCAAVLGPRARTDPKFETQTAATTDGLASPSG
jgi:hypothetical protein